MANARPELIFVAGPQAGERAVLMTNDVLVGRSPSADVHLEEHAASREQLRFQLTGEGWLMENLSAQGTRINGRRYKKNKKLILDTGDVISLGTETEVVYIAPGDDPEEAVQAYRQAHPPAKPPEPEPEPPKPQPKRAVPPPTPKPGMEKEVAAREAAKAQAAKAEGDEELEDEEKGSRKLKVILISVVLVGMVVFGLALIMKSVSGPDGDDRGRGGLPRLSNQAISEALNTPLGRSPSPTKAAIALDKAVQSYTNRSLWEPGDLYRCVKNFKLHRAYRHSKSFDSIQHENMAERAERELDLLIRDKYDAAWKFEKARSWQNARAAYEELLAVLPIAELDRNGPIYRVIIRNGIQHVNYIKRQGGRAKD